MLVKLNLFILGIFIILFFILHFFGFPNFDNTSSSGDIVYFLYTVVGVIASANIQYILLSRKKGYLELSGEFQPRYIGNSILYQNNYLHAHEDDIEFKYIKISFLGDQICDIIPNINEDTPYIINKSTTSKSFCIKLTLKSGELSSKIKISWIYSISGEKKIRKREKSLKFKRDLDAL